MKSVFSNSNGVTFGTSGNTITASVSPAGGGALTNIKISAGAASALLSDVTFSNANGVSFGLNGSTITASVPAALTSINISAGTTSQNLSNLVFSNSNRVSFGLNGSTVTAQHALNFSAGTTSNNISDQISFANGSNVSFGINGSTITASVASSLTAVNLSAGTTSQNLSAFVFSNSNRVSFGLNGSTVTAKHALNFSAGTTSNEISDQIVFSDSNRVSFGLNGSTVTAKHALNFSAGTTSNNISDQVVFSNSNGINFGLNGSTVTAAPNNISYWENYPPVLLVANSAATNSAALNLSVQRILIPAPITVTRLDYLAHYTVAGSTAGSSTMSVCVYTRNASSLSSASSTAPTMTHNSGTNSTGGGSIYAGQSGTRWRSLAINSWAMTPGEYWIGFIHSANGPAGTTGSMSIYGWSSVSVIQDIGGTRGVSDYFGHGIFSAATGAFPTSIGLSGLNQSGSGTHLLQPHFRLVGSFS